MLIMIYKCLHISNYPRYLKDLFTLRSATYSLRGTDILSLPKSRTTAYELTYFKYLSVKYWNSLPDNIRAIPTVS